MSARERNERRAEVVRMALSDVGIDPGAVYVNEVGDVRLRGSRLIDRETLWRAYSLAAQAVPHTYPTCLACFSHYFTTRDRSVITSCESSVPLTRACGASRGGDPQ